MTTTYIPANDSGVAAPEQSQKSKFANRVFQILLLFFLYVGLNYALAWFDAYRFGMRMLAEANEAFAQGNYLDALMGYEVRDAATGEAMPKGGYSKIIRLWEDEYAWPRPQAMIAQAQGQIDEILQSQLTIPDAEAFIQANIGLYNPYFGDVFLRLGELYEEAGDEAVAVSIYRDAIELLTDRPDIVEQAEEHLARLENEP